MEAREARTWNRPNVTALVCTRAAGRLLAAKGLDEARIANARMNTMAGVWEHPQLQARGRLQQVQSPQGPIAALLPPGAHSSFDYRMDPIPGVGEHTDAILRALGRSDEQVAALRAKGAI